MVVHSALDLLQSIASKYNLAVSDDIVIVMF